MLPSATALSTQQLAEFLAVVSAVHDGLSATRIAVERAARALEAEVATVLGDAGVASSVGFPLGRVPVAELAQVVGGDRWLLDVPGAGLCHTAVAPIAGRTPGHLLVARSGEDGFTVEEVSLLRGMARVLELTIGTLHTFEAERSCRRSSGRSPAGSRSSPSWTPSRPGRGSCCATRWRGCGCAIRTTPG